MVNFSVKKFFVFVIVFYGVFHFLPLDSLRVIMANSVASTLSALGLKATVNGASILTRFGRFSVVNECLGVVSIATFWSLMLSSTGISRRTKLLFSAIAVVLFPAWNYIRIVLSLILGREHFETFHFSLWMVSMVLIIGLYYASVRFSRGAYGHQEN